MKLQVRLFPDDTKSHHNENVVETTLNTELQKISNWMKINKILINYKKLQNTVYNDN